MSLAGLLYFAVFILQFQHRSLSPVSSRCAPTQTSLTVFGTGTYLQQNVLTNMNSYQIQAKATCSVTYSEQEAVFPRMFGFILLFMHTVNVLKHLKHLFEYAKCKITQGKFKWRCCAAPTCTLHGKSGPNEAGATFHTKCTYFCIAFVNGNTVQQWGECLLQAQH